MGFWGKKIRRPPNLLYQQNIHAKKNYLECLVKQYKNIASVSPFNSLRIFFAVLVIVPSCLITKLEPGLTNRSVKNTDFAVCCR